MTRRVRLGWLVTFGWITLWLILGFFQWTSVSTMSFHEWGDFFAGVSAPLAFLWLVIGYFQQGEELGQNTKALQQQEEALRLQVRELQQSVEQQKEMVKATQESTEINKVNVEREYLREKNRSQPVFDLCGGAEWHNDQKSGRGVCYVHVENKGHSISRVRFGFESLKGDVVVLLSYLDSWINKQSHTVEFSFANKAQFEVGDRLSLGLTYVDGIGEESKQVIHFDWAERDDGYLCFEACLGEAVD